MSKASPIIMLLVLLFSFVFASPDNHWYKDENYHCRHKHFKEHPGAENSCFNHCPRDSDCFDYIVVGLGAGGGVIAGRLAQECKHTTLALDLGSAVFDSELVTVPRYYLYNWNEPDNWKTTLPFRTVPQENAGGVTKNYMRGRGWGGSTTINGQVHVRGTKKNFDDWSDITGDETWDFEHVLPVFKKIENNVWHKDSIWHGTKGFNKVSRVLQGHDEWVDPKNYEVWNSITSAGIPFVDDIHGDPKTYAGLSYCSASVGFDPVTGHGTRSWVGKDLLKPAAERCSKLRIKSRSLVTRILFDGTRAVGVEYIEGEGIYSTEVNSTMGIRNAALHKKKFAFARMGVIVAAGTVNTPQLLKLSGIGPRAELEQFDIPVVVDLPGVGENLQDHVEFTVNYQFDSPTYIDSLGCSYGPRDASDPCATQYNRYYGTSGRVGNLDWNFDKKGEVECHAILSTDYPIWDFDHLPRPDSGPFPFPGIFGWLNEIMNPKSRGSVTLQSADPTEAPFIDPRYYSHPDDLRKAVGCWKLIEGIMANVSHAELFRPDPTTVTTDQEVEDYLRNIAWGHHMTGTARMGRKCDKMAVLDTNLRPFGTQNLYVVDASAFPKIVAGQPTFAVYMLAQKAFWKIKNFEKNMHNCEARF